MNDGQDPPVSPVSVSPDLPAYDPRALPAPVAAALAEEGIAGGRLEAVSSGELPGVVTSAHLLPHLLPEGLTSKVLSQGERREALLGAGDTGLASLPLGAAVGVDGPRGEALLAAHHPALAHIPVVDAAERALPRVAPLWEDVSRESRGEVLAPESWIPAAGQGIPILVVREGGEVAGDDRLAEEAASDAVLRGERRVNAAFPHSVVCVRGQSFTGGVRFRAILLSTDGTRAVRAAELGTLQDVDGVVDRLLTRLEQRGGSRIR